MLALGFLTSVVLIVVGTWVYLEAGFADMRSDEDPSAWESRLMYSAVHASVRRRAPKLRNPFPVTDELLIAGRETLLGRLHRVPRRSRKTSQRVWRDVLSARAAVPADWDPIFGSGSFLDREARDSEDRNAPSGAVLFRRQTVEPGSVHYASQPPATHGGERSSVGVSLKREKGML